MKTETKDYVLQYRYKGYCKGIWIDKEIYGQKKHAETDLDSRIRSSEISWRVVYRIASIDEKIVARKNALPDNS